MNTPPSIPRDADLIVVGGGIVGLCCGYAAAREGKQVVVLSESRVGEATPVAGGMLAPASEAEVADTDLLAFALESCRRYPEFIRDVEADSGVDCGYRDEGSLLIALHRDHVADLEHLAEFQRGHGLRTQWLSSKDITRREPMVAPRQVGGLLAQDDRQVDPRAMAVALRAAIGARGGKVVDDARVQGLHTTGSRAAGVRATVQGHDVTVKAPQTLVAAGVWSHETFPELDWVPSRPVRGQVARLRGEPLIDHVVRTPDVYLVPRRDGDLIVGATADERGYDPTCHAGALMNLLRDAWFALPGSAELAFVETITGYRPTLSDHRPAIGPTPVEGLFLATGHFRHGILLAVATARGVARGLTADHWPDDLAPFSPLRFSGEAATRTPDAPGAQP